MAPTLGRDLRLVGWKISVTSFEVGVGRGSARSGPADVVASDRARSNYELRVVSRSSARL